MDECFVETTKTCDYISRQAAIDALKDMYHAAEKWGEEASDDVIKARAESCMASLIEMKLRIEKLPAAQPEIIRCKDCNKSSKCYGDVIMISRGGGYIYCPLEYCSQAERRTDE